MVNYTPVDDVIDHALAFDLSVPVRDQRPTTGEQLLAYVLAGDDGDPESDEGVAGSTDFARATFEADERDGVGEVLFAVASQSGRSDAGDLAACRESSEALLGELVAAWAADPTQGGAVADSWVSNVTTVEGRNEAGAYVRRVVTLAFEVL